MGSGHRRAEERRDGLALTGTLACAAYGYADPLPSYFWMTASIAEVAFFACIAK